MTRTPAARPVPGQGPAKLEAISVKCLILPLPQRLQPLRPKASGILLKNLGIPPRSYGHTSRASHGVSLPSGSRTWNLQILDPEYKPLHYSGDAYYDSDHAPRVPRPLAAVARRTRIHRSPPAVQAAGSDSELSQ
jgi:hypothetical protein